MRASKAAAKSMNHTKLGQLPENLVLRCLLRFDLNLAAPSSNDDGNGRNQDGQEAEAKSFEGHMNKFGTAIKRTQVWAEPWHFSFRAESAVHFVWPPLSHQRRSPEFSINAGPNFPSIRAGISIELRAEESRDFRNEKNS